MKLYVKEKTASGKVYYPFVNNVIIKGYPCKTATEAQTAGEVLFKSLQEGEELDYDIIR